MKDTQQRYGTISRFFHWAMAVGFFWMAVTVILKLVADETGIQKFFWSTHKAVGGILLIMITLRSIWMFATLKTRSDSFSLPAQLGHIALYLLMLSVSTIGFLRQYGAGKPFEVFGIKLFEADIKYQWMVDLGNSVHGLLAWCLLAFAAGHIIMALVHYFGKDKGLMKLMI